MKIAEEDPARNAENKRLTDIQSPIIQKRCNRPGFTMGSHFMIVCNETHVEILLLFLCYGRRVHQLNQVNYGNIKYISILL